MLRPMPAPDGFKFSLCFDYSKGTNNFDLSSNLIPAPESVTQILIKFVSKLKAQKTEISPNFVKLLALTKRFSKT